jgi:UTP--glucose-1-phosphate uridylyltransferase
MHDRSNRDSVAISRRIEPFAAAMENAGMPVPAISTFRLHLRRYLEGATGTIGRDHIEPVSELPDLEDPGVRLETTEDQLARVVVIKLNGGLGTGMGLERAKSLIDVRPGISFLDLIARQMLGLRRPGCRPIPALFMNSFRTQADTETALTAYPDLAVDGLPMGFLQHKVPKVLVETERPAECPSDPEMAWCPPGHGDIYTALLTSGVLSRLLDTGYDLAFVSNSDNLGAVLDPVLLGHMLHRRASFMMEVADRTPADRKGGHLCRLRDGRLALRESAQCPADETEDFQDIDRYRYFNTNNIWLSLPVLAELLEQYSGALPLDTIVNRKTLDPRDPGSPAVVQLETAMGAAVSLFDDAIAVRVPRSRFSPVKNTNDLLAVRSDAYRLTDDGRIVLGSDRSSPPTIVLDPKHFKLLDEFDRRFADGPPSLRHCTSLQVWGNVSFGKGVVVEGEVTIRGGDAPSSIPNGAILASEHRC